MLVESQIDISGSRSAVWSVMTDIEHAADILSGVLKIEIVERPTTGLVGLRWRETREYFGKPATVEKRITDAVENESYQTRAEDSGFVFLTTMRIADSDSGCTLVSGHDTQPQGLAAKLKAAPMFLFKGVIRKALLQDLTDLKTAVEKA
jgi:carbon monoxide dehydrogenase subunit G